jgi:hypothetical protein
MGNGNGFWILLFLAGNGKVRSRETMKRREEARGLRGHENLGLQEKDLKLERRKNCRGDFQLPPLKL